jgi:hypothetical protein
MKLIRLLVLFSALMMCVSESAAQFVDPAHISPGRTTSLKIPRRSKSFLPPYLPLYPPGATSVSWQGSQYVLPYNERMTVRIWTTRGFQYVTMVMRRNNGRIYPTVLSPTDAYGTNTRSVMGNQTGSVTISPSHYQAQQGAVTPKGERRSLIPGISDAKLRRIISKPRG